MRIKVLLLRGGLCCVAVFFGAVVAGSADARVRTDSDIRLMGTNLMLRNVHPDLKTAYYKIQFGKLDANGNFVMFSGRNPDTRPFVGDSVFAQIEFTWYINDHGQDGNHYRYSVPAGGNIPLGLHLQAELPKGVMTAPPNWVFYNLPDEATNADVTHYREVLNVWYSTPFVPEGTPGALPEHQSRGGVYDVVRPIPAQ